jgi:hypothetical protein
MEDGQKNVDFLGLPGIEEVLKRSVKLLKLAPKSG